MLMSISKSVKDYIVLFVVLASVLFLGYTVGTVLEAKTLSGTPEIVLRLLYEFDKPEDLESNMGVLLNYVTPDVLKDLEFTDSRVINVYYKFKSKPSRVKILERYDGVIYYSIVNENIDPNDIFAFEYKMNNDGQLVYVNDYSVRVIAKG